MFGASHLMKLNVIMTCFVFSFSMCHLAISFFLSFIQEVFHVYLNEFEIVVTHLFFVILCKI